MYGADVANALTLYWLLRFRPLRRIEERHVYNSTEGNSSHKHVSIFIVLLL